MLLTVGDLVEDVLVVLSGPPLPGTDTTCRIVRSRGGSAANVAVAAIEADLAPEVLFADAGEAAYLELLHDPLPVPVTVVKDGPHPAVVLAGGRRVEVPAEPVDGEIDTTGVGDAFAAGFLVATLGGAEPGEATKAGHRLAAAAIARVGALS